MSTLINSLNKLLDLTKKNEIIWYKDDEEMICYNCTFEDNDIIICHYYNHDQVRWEVSYTTLTTYGLILSIEYFHHGTESYDLIKEIYENANPIIATP